MLNIAITLAVAIIGGILGRKIRLPAGFVVGALLATGILSVLWQHASFPSQSRLAVQIVAGAYIGMSVTRDTIRQLKKLLAPSLLLFFGMTAIAFLIGWLISEVSGLSLVTSLLSTVPGGMVDMTMISLDMGADAQVVAVLQLERLVFILLVFPLILKRCFANGKKSSPSPACKSIPQTQKTMGPGRWRWLLTTLLVASAAGFSLYLLKVPAGAITGAMLAVAALNIFSAGQAYVEPLLKTAAQIMAGVLVGISIRADSVRKLQLLAVPALLVLLECLLISGVLGWLMWKIYKVDLATALYGSAPGGLSDMALISIDEGGDPSQVMLLQLVRYIGSIALLPPLIKLLCSVV